MIKVMAILGLFLSASSFAAAGADCTIGITNETAGNPSGLSLEWAMKPEKIAKILKAKGYLIIPVENRPQYVLDTLSGTVLSYDPLSGQQYEVPYKNIRRFSRDDGYSYASVDLVDIFWCKKHHGFSESKGNYLKLEKFFLKSFPRCGKMADFESALESCNP